MDWLKELLKDLPNAADLEKSITESIGKNFVSKVDFNTVNETKKQLEKDVIERDGQLENLKKIDAEGLQAEIIRLQGENQTAKTTFENDLKDLQLTNAIKLALNGKVHDEDLASQLIKKDELVISEDGKIVGLDEQVNTLKENKGFLFVEEEQKQQLGFQKIGNESPKTQEGIDNAVSAAFGNVTQTK